jgi:sugar phosphate isomerase/epimerase
MSIEIKFHIPDVEVQNPNALADHMAALGFHKVRIEGEINWRGHTAAQAEPAPTMETVKAEIEASGLSGDEHHAPAAPAKRTRRTKAEIEADKAKEVVKELDQAAVAEERAISATPEDRKQDEADEAAEKTEELTTDSVRKLAGDYVAKFGIAAANEDGHRVFTAALGPVPADLTDTKGAPVTQWRMSVIPSDADSLRKMVHAWEEALETNPFDRTAVS